jgi:glycosyltransferase involved in cell wall biosynthesis
MEFMSEYYEEATQVLTPSSTRGLFCNTTPSESLKLSVILPVRNECEHIWTTLDALRQQEDDRGYPLPYADYEVLFLANNCTDNSAEIGRAYQSIYPEFQLHIEEIQLDADVAHIGTVRRMLMDASYNRFAYLNKRNGIIASTDSDSEVDKHWVHNTIAEINKGNDVVGGRILTRPERSMSRAYYLRDVTYKHLVSKAEALLDPLENDPWPRHYQCFGASFAVTCFIYNLSGRLPVVPFLEDMAFHRALTRIDARIRLSPLVRVMTSTRIQGRVDFGLSIQLKQWGEMNEAHDPILVEQADTLFQKLSARRMLRLVWDLKRNDLPYRVTSVQKISDMLMIDHQWLDRQINSFPYFGMLWEKIEEELGNGFWGEKWPKMDVVKVIPDLRYRIHQYQRTGS